MMNKYCLWLSAALIGCSATACMNPQNESAAKPDQKASAAPQQDGKNLFADTDAARRAAVAEYKKLSAVPVSKEQQKYNSTFNGKAWEIRKNAQKDLAAAEKGLRALFADQKASPEARYALLPEIVEFYYRAKDYPKALQLVDEFLAIKEPAFRASPVRTRLMQQKINTLGQMKLTEKRIETMLERLCTNMSEKDAFNLKRDIIYTYCRSGLAHLAEPYARALCAAQDLDEKQQIAAADSLIQVACAQKNLKKDREAMALYRKFQKDDNAYAKKRLEHGGWYQFTLGNYPMAYNMRKEVLEDKSLSTAVRIDAYRALCSEHIMFIHTSFDPMLVITFAEKNLLPLKDLTPDQHYKVREQMFRAYQGYIRDDAKAEEMMRKVLAFPNNPQNITVLASVKLAEVFAAKRNYAEAEKILDNALALPKLHINDLENLCKTKARILSWQERCDDAVALLRSKIDPKDPNTVRRFVPAIAGTYRYFLRWDDMIKIYTEFNMPLAAANAVADRYPDKAKALARKVLVNEKAPLNDRIEALTFFSGKDAEAVALRKKYPELYAASGNRLRTMYRFNDAVFGGDYDTILDIIAIREKAGIDIDYDSRNVQLQALASKHRFAEMGDVAEKIAALKTKHGAKDYMIFAGRMFKNAAKMKAGDFAAFCKNYAYPEGTSLKKKSNLILYAVRIANIARMYDASREIYKVYDAMFVPEPKKTYVVPFSDKPILGLSDFLAIEKSIEPQLMDRKFGGNMDFLVTDVSTGDRGSAITNANKNAKYKPVEIRIVCDEFGLHMMYTVFDPESAKIATGLMGAGSFEMYLSPGENQPYLCLLPNLENGSCGIWNSSYNTRQWRQTTDSEISYFRTQHQFTPDGYIFYMFLSWKKFYDKLPEKKGDCWDFENVFWSRFGGYGWNGTKSIHGRSTWGKLDFSITDAQLRKIKRHIIVDASKAYKKELSTNYACHGAVDMWKNDDKLGDPAFFKEKVAPITDKLNADLKCVTPDMDDATVDRLYQEAVPGWYEIRLTIADLRRRYLQKKLSE